MVSPSHNVICIKLDILSLNLSMFVSWLRPIDTLNVKMNAVQTQFLCDKTGCVFVFVCEKVESELENNRDNIQYKHRTTDHICTCGFSYVVSCGSGVPNAMSECHSCFTTITQYTSGAKTENMEYATGTHKHECAIMAAQLGCRQFHEQDTDSCQNTNTPVCAEHHHLKQ